MVDLSFQLKTKQDGTVILMFGLFFRIVFAILAGILGWGLGERLVLDGTVPVISAVLFAVVVLGMLYEERWELNPNSRSVSSRQGLLIFSRRRCWTFDEITAVEYTSYRAGSVPDVSNTDLSDTDDTVRATSRFGHIEAAAKRRFLRYSLVLQDGRKVRIELRRVRDWTTEKTIPEVVAHTIGVPLEFTPL